MSDTLKTKIKLGIVGNGFVGKASRILENEKVTVLSYDKNPALCNPLGTTLFDIGSCDIIFVCVPTPMNSDGSVHLNIVNDVVNSIKQIKKNDSEIIIRSTVPPNTSASLDVYFMPEFLTEKNYENDFINNEIWMFGLVGNEHRDELFKNKIKYIINKACQYKKIKSNKIEWMSNTEAELVKYFKNAFLATKVSFCNEIAEYCDKINVNYDKVRKMACSDPRIGDSHSYVPGHDGKRGFGGTCFPKDVTGLLNQLKNNDIKSYVLESVIKRNNEVDRKDHDWKKNHGRSII